MAKFKITVTQNVPCGDLDRDDIEEFGEHENGDVVREETVTADSEDEALDDFNADVPIALPENYDVEAEEVSDED